MYAGGKGVEWRLVKEHYNLRYNSISIIADCSTIQVVMDVLMLALYCYWNIVMLSCCCFTISNFPSLSPNCKTSSYIYTHTQPTMNRLVFSTARTTAKSSLHSVSRRVSRRCRHSVRVPALHLFARSWKQQRGHRMRWSSIALCGAGADDAMLPPLASVRPSIIDRPPSAMLPRMQLPVKEQQPPPTSLPTSCVYSLSLSSPDLMLMPASVRSDRSSEQVSLVLEATTTSRNSLLRLFRKQNRS